MLRKVKQYMAILTDPPKKSVLLDCGHTVPILDGGIYLKGYDFDCPYCERKEIQLSGKAGDVKGEMK